MKVSVIIIAHDEEKYIAQCIESILNQTKKADQVVLILHNSTDRTKEIAQQYPITLVEFSGPQGITYARLEGIKHLTGDIVLGIDGDSYAERNWIKEMITELEDGNILVGSWIKFRGTVYGSSLSLLNKFFSATKGKRAVKWIWGPSYGYWNKDREKIQHAFKESIRLARELHLSRNPDDYWLALFMNKEGKLAVTNKTHVVNNTKELTSLQAVKRNAENMRNVRKINTYFYSKDNQIA